MLVPEGEQLRLQPLQTYPRMALDWNLFAMKASERSGVWQNGMEEVKPLCGRRPITVATALSLVKRPRHLPGRWCRGRVVGSLLHPHDQGFDGCQLAVQLSFGFPDQRCLGLARAQPSGTKSVTLSGRE